MQLHNMLCYILYVIWLSIHLQSEEEWETYLLGVSVPDEFVGSSEEDDNSQQLTIPTAQSHEREVVTTSVSTF